MSWGNLGVIRVPCARPGGGERRSRRGTDGTPHKDSLTETGPKGVQRDFGGNERLNRWAFVWARRLENHADNPQCRAVFRKSILSNKEGIREVLSADILALLEETAGGDDPEDCRRLAPILFDVDRKMMTQ